MIDDHKFGSFVVDGRMYLGDIKIVNNRVRHWEDRRKHIITLENIKDLLESNPEMIIIGTGNSGLLKIHENVKEIIMGRRIKLFIDKNLSAIKKYNETISENRKGAALFHATC